MIYGVEKALYKILLDRILEITGIKRGNYKGKPLAWRNSFLFCL